VEDESRPWPLQVGGVFPSHTVKADMVPVRSETGIGALMPWAGRLWMITYVSHQAASGAGTGLFEIGPDMRMHKRPESRVGTYANRMLHAPSHQMIMGPHLIDVEGNVRTIDEVADYRLTATMVHLEDPENKVYFLTMEGLLLEVDLHTLAATDLSDLNAELGIPEGAQPHYKGSYTGGGRLVVANNTYEEEEFLGVRTAGRLAEWDGNNWTILERKPYNEVAGRSNMGGVVYATGWDRASALLNVLANGEWTRYRLPKASHCFDHFWQTEWPRIRPVESERNLMDCHGMFYELSPVAYGGRVWGVRPISTHLRIIPDYCSWQGLLVLAGNQVTPIYDTNLLAGESQANLWFGKTDDLWGFGKPAGWGGPWWDDLVEADRPSDPYLMTGFDKKVLHLSHEAEGSVAFRVEVDFLGDGSWRRYDLISVPSHGYVHHEFPTGFSAHWVWLIADAPCRATAHFTYT
jgi:hypothetical protein